LALAAGGVFASSFFASAAGGTTVLSTAAFLANFAECAD